MLAAALAAATLLLVLSIPNPRRGLSLRSRRAGVIASLRNVWEAGRQHLEKHGLPASVRELVDANLLSKGFLDEERRGYRFRIDRDGTAFAWPVAAGEPYLQSFLINNDGDMFARAGFAADHAPRKHDVSWQPSG